MSFRILVTARSFRKTPGRHKELLEQSGYQIAESPLDRPLKEAEMVELISDVDGAILGLDEVTAKVIAAGKRLKVISRYGVGVDNVDLEAATAAGVAVTNTPGANSIAVAELTLGIVGLGQVSKEVITRAACFAMQILVHTNHPDEGLTEAYGVEYVPLDRLLREADFVSLHCSLTPERVKLIGEKELKTMKPTSCLINTARGELVDEEALYRALRGAGSLGQLAMSLPRSRPRATLC